MRKNDHGIYQRLTWRDPSQGLYSLKHFNPARFEYFDRFVDEWSGREVLDVGCGGGFTSEFMAKRGVRVAGLDRSSHSIEEARRSAEAQDLTIRYDVGVAEQLPHDAESFDLVVCVDVLEHVDSLSDALSEVHRVLRPGGYLLYDTINRTFLARAVMIWLLEYVLRQIPKGTHDHALFIKPEELLQHFESTGFESLDMKGFDNRGPDRKNGGFDIRITDFLGVSYVGVAQKRS